MIKYILSFLFICSIVSAQIPVVEPPVGKCDCRYSSIRMGGSYSYAWITPKGFPTFQGNLGGAQGIYEYKRPQGVYEGVKFAYRQGNTHQEGQTRTVLFFDVHERIGYTFAACDCDWMASFYTGLGYHYLDQTLKQPELANLFFKYNEFYVPVGFSLVNGYHSSISYGLTVTWMPQVFPSVVIDPLGGTNWVIKRKLANVLVEAPLIFSRCKRLVVELKPFFEYWQDGKTVAKSDEGVGLAIPGNTYLFAGVEVNLGYAF